MNTLLVLTRRRRGAKVCAQALTVAAVFAVLYAPCAVPAGQAIRDDGGKNAMTLSITTSAFSDHGEIPAQYTCDGKDISPPLSWSGAPSGTKSLALIVDDPDAPDPAAPKMTWVHWVMYNIPPTATGLAEAVRPHDLPAGTLQGVNDWKRTGYGGPCPPIGRHRYFYKLYALDVMLPDLRSPTKASVEKAMKGHVLAEAQVVGTYQRGR
jgi:Raf kinase inhibitor-like YbhB/YbcL family protein